MKRFGQNAYRKLDIDTPLSDGLQTAIDNFVEYINTQDGLTEDCYRTEIDIWIKDMYMQGQLSDHDYEMLREYYVLGGIYDAG